MQYDLHPGIMISDMANLTQFRSQLAQQILMAIFVNPPHSTQVPIEITILNKTRQWPLGEKGGIGAKHVQHLLIRTNQRCDYLQMKSVFFLIQDSYIS
jgi:hypothetical protein